MKTLRIALSLAIVTLAMLNQTESHARRPISKNASSRLVFVLIHSPLVGPATWEAVANEMRQRRIIAVVPTLRTVEGTNVPFWKQHAERIFPITFHMDRSNYWSIWLGEHRNDHLPKAVRLADSH